MAPGCCRLWLQITLHCEPTVHLRKYKQKHKFVFCIWSYANTNTEVEGSECQLHLIENQLWDWLCCHNCGFCQTVSFLQLLFPGNTNLSKKTVESVSSYKSVRVRPAQFVGEEALGRLWGGGSPRLLPRREGSSILLPRRIACITSMQGRISYIATTQGRIANVTSMQGRSTQDLYCRGGSPILLPCSSGEKQGRSDYGPLLRQELCQSKFYLTPILPTLPYLHTCKFI